MAKSSRVRWECPVEKHPAVLGPKRPPKDAIVRFCLPCSEEHGRLVLRSAPAVERVRAQRAQRAAAKAQTKRERDAEARRASFIVKVREIDGSLGELDVRQTLLAMLRLPELRERRRDSGQLLPDIIVVRRRSDGLVSGHAKTTRGETVVSIGRCSRQQAEELILHEATHGVCAPHEGHGGAFRASLLRAARQWWPGINTPKNEGDVYEMDSLIVEAAEQLAKSQLSKSDQQEEKTMVKLKISPYVAFVTSGSDISHPDADSGYDPGLVAELSRVSFDKPTVIEVTPQGALDLAEFCDALEISESQGGNASGARSLATLAATARAAARSAA